MSWQLATWIGLGLVALIGIIAAVVEHETKKRKANVRLPRKVSWDRVAEWRRHG